MIVASAVRVGAMICTMPPPARHADILHSLHHLGIGSVEPEAQGFLTASGTFAHRQLAHRIAFKSGQVAQLDGELFSEDLW